jgi:hypothetical protein
MSRHKDFVVAGDIGCYTLGGSAHLNALDSVVCMGGGFTVAMGMANAFEMSGVTGKKVFGVLGDSTFFHSGMTGAAEILYNKGSVIPVVLDNHITGMTGHQDNPGSGYTLQGDMAAAIKIAPPPQHASRSFFPRGSAFTMSFAMVFLLPLYGSPRFIIIFYIHVTEKVSTPAAIQYTSIFMSPFTAYGTAAQKSRAMSIVGNIFSISSPPGSIPRSSCGCAIRCAS